jgi:hypothetical protein
LPFGKHHIKKSLNLSNTFPPSNVIQMTTFNTTDILYKKLIDRRNTLKPLFKTGLPARDLIKESKTEGGKRNDKTESGRFHAHN